MKNFVSLFLSTLVLAAINPLLSTVQAQGTAFMYQGRLNSGGSVASGTYDIVFSLYTTNVTGGRIAGPVTNIAVAVTNGLFTTPVDFGNPFTGTNNWLELAVRTNGAASFATLTPRQPLLPVPYALVAGTVSGPLAMAQLPPGIVTDNATNVSLTGTFGGKFGSFSNLFLGLQTGQENRLQFNDKPGSQQVFLHAKRNLDFETENDSTVWVGHDYTSTIDHDFLFHVKHNETFTVDNNLTETIGLNHSLSIGGSMNLTVGGSMVTSVGNNVQVAVGNNYSIVPLSGGVGIGTPDPQGSLHVYSTSNPTVVRVQSAGTPGFGRLEFVSNPQGDINEWRPAFIQSLDAGNFTGGMGFYVNGTGGGNKFSSSEVMRIQNGRVGIGTTAATSLLQVGDAICNGTTWANASDRNVKENFQPVNVREVLDKVASLPMNRWNYKQDKSQQHLGPMAQDFYTAFNVGPDDKHITTVDEGGVALAAIQGLNEKLKEKETEIADLRARLNRLEKALAAD